MLDLDSNELGSGDEAFSQLKVWIDKNADGISQSEELFTLEEMGIKEINLQKNNTSTMEDGNIITGTATYTTIDQIVHKIAELNFETDSVDTKQVNKVPISKEVASLPELNGIGTVM